MPTREPRLTWGGKVILTIPHAAARHRMSVDAMRKAIKRAEQAGLIAAITPPPIDERTPTYYQTALDKVISERVGTGANLRGHG
jgi:hypothetical protein